MQTARQQEKHRSLFNQQWLRLQHLCNPTCPNTSTRAGSNATASSSRIAKDGFKRRTCRRQCRLSVGNKEEAKPAEPVIVAEAAFDDTAFNEEEDQKRRAAERINKLRNLSFNMNSADSGGEYDNVPAYVRRNMELFGNTLTSVEQFYSKYTVKKKITMKHIFHL